MNTPPPAMIEKLRAECFQTARYESPAWADSDDGINRVWFGTVECDSKRIIFERWIETHPRKRRPYEAVMQIGCHLLVLPMALISPSSLSAGGACHDLNGDE